MNFVDDKASHLPEPRCSTMSSLSHGCRESYRSMLKADTCQRCQSAHSAALGQQQHQQRARLQGHALHAIQH